MAIALDPSIKKHLYEYQVSHAINLIHILTKNNAVLDASDPGTGKTYVAGAVCAHMKRKPIVICPRSVISTWKTVLKIYNVEPLLIVNHESIKTGKYYVDGKRVKCPYIQVLEQDDEITYKWLLDKEQDYVFIFDEVHRCQNISTHNGQLLYAAKQVFYTPIMLLSATIIDTYEKFRLFFYILNFISPDEVIKQKLSYSKYQHIVTKWLIRDQNPLMRVHNMLFPDRAGRMRIDVLGDHFPTTQIIAQPYTLESSRALEIEKAYSDINLLLQDLKNKSAQDRGNILTKVLRAHQRIELFKVPTFIELANDFMTANHSVVIFVNFTQTLKMIAKMLNSDCLVYGEQTQEQREINIDSFQNNESRVIICNIKAGGVGVSLHDLHGGHPRVSLISPTWSSVDLVQALGRIHRAGSKTKTIQRIIYAADTVEEKIADKLRMKLANISTINDGDLDLTNIVFERERLKI